MYFLKYGKNTTAMKLIAPAQCAFVLPFVFSFLILSPVDTIDLASSEHNSSQPATPHEKLSSIAEQDGMISDEIQDSNFDDLIDETNKSKLLVVVLHEEAKSPSYSNHEAETDNGGLDLASQQQLDATQQGELGSKNNRLPEPGEDCNLALTTDAMGDFDQLHTPYHDSVATVTLYDELTTENVSYLNNPSLIETTHVTKAENVQRKEAYINNTAGVALNSTKAGGAQDYVSPSHEGGSTDEKEGDPRYSTNTSESESVEATTLEPQQQPSEDDDEDDHHVKSVNYAHKNAGAIILSSSTSFKGTSNLLVSDDDKYAIAPCADKKIVVISLSEDILVKEVLLSNYEKYSSSVKEFQILGSQDYVASKPNAHWQDLGTYTAKPTSGGEEKFTLIEPSWARYLKFRFLTHYGHEHYCTVTQIKVQGSTMVQGFHEQWKESEKELEELRRGVIASDHEHIDDQKASLILSDNNESLFIEDFSTKRDAVKEHAFHESEEAGIVEVDAVSHHSNASNYADSTAKGVLRNTAQGETLIAADTNETEVDAEQDADDKGIGPEKTEIVTEQLLHQQGEHSDEIRPSNLNSLNASPEKCKTADEKVVREDPSPREELVAGEVKSGSGSTAFILPDTTVVSLQNVPVAGQVKHQSTASGDSEDVAASTSVPSLDETPDLRKVLSEDKIQPVASETDSKVKSSTSEEPQKPFVERELKPALESAQLLSQQEHLLELSNAILALIEKYPGAKCLQSLSLNEFKSKFQARATKAKPNSEPGGAAQTSPLKIEPIFKTLTDEIKALQVHMSIYDQYIVEMTSCYQLVMMMMATDSQRLEKSQAARLYSIEKRLDEFRTKQDCTVAVILNILHAAFSNALILAVETSSFYIKSLCSKGLENSFPIDVAINAVLVFLFIFLMATLYWKRTPCSLATLLSDSKSEKKDVERINEGNCIGPVKDEYIPHFSHNTGNYEKKRNRSKKNGKGKYHDGCSTTSALK